MSAEPSEVVAGPQDDLTTGERIRLLRQRAKLSQEQLAEKAGVKGSTLSDVERDAVHPSAEFIRLVAVALGTSTDYLLRLSHSPTRRKTSEKKRHLTAYPGRGRSSPKVVQPPLMSGVP